MSKILLIHSPSSPLKEAYLWLSHNGFDVHASHSVQHASKEFDLSRFQLSLIDAADLTVEGSARKQNQGCVELQEIEINAADRFEPRSGDEQGPVGAEIHGESEIRGVIGAVEGRTGEQDEIRREFSDPNILDPDRLTNMANGIDIPIRAHVYIVGLIRNTRRSVD